MYTCMDVCSDPMIADSNNSYDDSDDADEKDNEFRKFRGMLRKH